MTSSTGGRRPLRPLVVIPAWNESGSVAEVIREIRAVAPAGTVVLVVDDGSIDATAFHAAEAGALVAQLPFNVGVGGAMRAGFLFAQRNGHDAVIQVDADGQHDPRYLEQLLDLLAEYDIAVGARFAGVGEYSTGGPRRWAMRLLAWTVSRLVGTPLTDVTSGFRGAGPRALALFARDYPAEYLSDTVESLVIAHRAGLGITQIGVEMRPRSAGTPSQGPIKASIYLARAALVLALAVVRPAPAPVPEEELPC